MSDFITFTALAARSITDIQFRSNGTTVSGVTGTELDDDAIISFDATATSFSGLEALAAAAGHGDLTSLNENALDGAFYLGGTHHIQFRDFFALVSAENQGTTFGEGDTLFKLSDTGYGARLTDATIGQSKDPVAIFGHGRINNGTVGEASALQAGGQGVGFDNAWGFGFDNGPESGNRWLNNGDAITFALTGEGKAIKTASFTINTDQALAGIKLDVDGTVLKSGSYNASQNAANVDFLAALSGANGVGVVLDFDARTASVGGVAQGADVVAALFAAYDANLATGLSQITIGATDGARFSIQDLALERVDTGTLPAANALISYVFEAGQLRATLDLGRDGSIEAKETLATAFGGGGVVTGDPDGSNPAQLLGTGMPIDILDLTTIGVADANAPQGHQVGTLDRSWGLGIDTGAPGANLADGSSLGGNYGDESGGNDLNGGEFVRFDLGTSFAGVSALIDIADRTELVTRAGTDAIVRLFNGGALIETAYLDFDVLGLADLRVQDNLGLSTFDRIEIEAAAGARFAIADLDIEAFVADVAGVAAAIGETLTLATVLDATDPTPENNDVTVPQDGGATPIDNGTDRFAAFRDANGNGFWDLGETKEDLVSFGNGTAATEIDTAGGLVDLTTGGGAVSGNQFFLGVGNGGHLNGLESLTFGLQGGEEALAGAVTIRGAVASNPQNNALADIAAGTEFLVRLFDDANANGAIDAGELVEELSFTVATAQQAFTTSFADAEAGRFTAVQVAAVSGGGAFTLDSLDLFLA